MYDEVFTVIIVMVVLSDLILNGQSFIENGTTVVFYLIMSMLTVG